MKHERKTGFEESWAWLLKRHGNIAQAAYFLGMTPQNLARVVSDIEGTRTIWRTRQWICDRVREERG